MDGGLILPPGFRTAGARLELDPSDPINRGLVGWWPLDQAGGTTARDIGPARRHGSLVNFNSTATSGWGAGPFGRVLNTDGTDDHVNIGTNIIGQNGSFTASIWFRYSTANRAIWGRGLDAFPDAWSVTVRITSANTLDAYVVTTSGGVAGYGAAGSTTLVVGRWYHVWLVYTEGATLRAFLNGAEEINVSLAGTSVLRIASSPVYLGMGENGGGADRYLNGAISDFRVWPVPRPVAEARRLYLDRRAGAIDPAARLFFVVGQASALPPFSADFAHTIDVTSAASAAMAFSASASDTIALAAVSAGAMAFYSNLASEVDAAGAATGAMGFAGSASTTIDVATLAAGTVAFATASDAFIGLDGAMVAALAVSASVDAVVLVTTAAHVIDGAAPIVWPDWVPPGRRVAIGPDLRRVAFGSDRRRAVIPGDRRRTTIPD